MSENKKKVNEKVAKPNEDSATVEQKEKKGLAARHIPFIVTAAILVVVMIGAVIFVVVDAINRDANFNYLKSDLSKYVEFTDDYKNFSIDVDIASPREEDVKISILNMLYADRETTPLYGGEMINPAVITPGDEVHIWYRGYLVGDGDEKTVIAGLSNFGNDDPTVIGIGSNGAFPGFELSLVNVNTEEYSKFVKITSGKVTEGQIAYISFTKTKGDDTSTKTKESNVRLDFSEDLDAIYGAGFEEKIMGLEIGKNIDISATLDSTVYNYTDLTVNFVTECENNPIIVEAYVAYDYSVPTLRNENLVFEVYVDGVVIYDTPEFNDEYLKKKIEDEELNVTLEELEALGKDSLTANYYAYAENLMKEIYEDEKKALVETEVWAYFAEISKGIKYPKSKVEEVYNDYVDDIIDQFVSSNGYIYNYSLGQYKQYTDFDQYAAVSLGLSSTADWKAEVYKQSEGFIKERMVMFYILRAENLLPTAEKLTAEYDSIVQEYLDEAIEQYFEYHDKTREDYTDEEYEEVIEECREIVFSSFSEEYFTIRAYYNILAEHAIEWPEVVTLDDRRAYPQDK